jgi:N6-L-threonylcarbamoyladenine synthase
MKNNNKNNIFILGIETSCDDTCASVIKDGNVILSNIVSSQNEIHAKYGGVVPEIASRKHIEVIDLIISEAMQKAGITYDDVHAVAVTNRPGLLGSLLVGVGAAKAISYYYNKPIIAINHLKAHIYANFLTYEKPDDEFIGLIVSGGHSSLYYVKDLSNINEIGHTVDDAAGEAFDKISRYLELGYPGGPVIDKLSKNGNPDYIAFPRPMIDSKDYNFSFSGIKTSLIYKTKKDPDLLKEENIPSLVASFQKAAIEVLVEKTFSAAHAYGVKKILISGGVAANSLLREEFHKRAVIEKMEVYIPPIYLCMDNAAMIACLGYYEYLDGNISDYNIDVYSRSDI